MMNSNNYLNGRFGAEMVIVKASIYKKHWSRTDTQTGEVHEGDRYLTLVASVPKVEFTPSIDLLGKTKRPDTRGVFVATIGSTEGLIVTNSRVGLRTYQDHLESLGWTWVQTVPKSKGKSWEWVQREAWWIIKHPQSQANKYQENWYALRNAVDDMMAYEIQREGGEERSAALLSVSIVMDSIENPET